MIKYVGPSKYKYVTEQLIDGKTMWRGMFYKNGSRNGKSFETEREAAIYVDKKLLEQGKEPVNILVRK